MKKKTLKKLIVVFFVLTVVISSGMIYLNEVFLPTKIKSLILQAIETKTQKKASLDSVQFNIFKGLVLKNLTLYDEDKTVFSLKEGSCSFLILPIFREKKIIIPSVRLIDPEIFIERRSDNTINLSSLLPKKAQQEPKSKFSIYALKVNIIDARIDFQDNYLSPVFAKSLENLNLNLALSLPAGIKFNLKSDIPAKPKPINITADGEFKIPEKQLSGLIKINNLNPREFSGYYPELDKFIRDGVINSIIKLSLQGNTLDLELDSQALNLILANDKMLARINAGLKAKGQYNLSDKKISYGGSLNIARLDIDGIEKIDKIENLNGLVNFNQNSLSSENLNLSIFQVPFQAKLNIADLNSGLVNLNLSAELDLNTTQRILNDKLEWPSLPLNLQGKGKLSLDLETKIPFSGVTKLNGSLDILSAQAAIDKIKNLITGISGHLEFDLNGLRWEKFSAEYSGNTYSINGSLKNFALPNINLDLSTKDLSLESELNIKEKLISIPRLKGRYLSSDFAAEGWIDTSSSISTPIKITAGMNLDLQDLKKPLSKFKDIFEKIKPNGILNTELNIEGDIRNLKGCLVKAKLSSPSLFLYGLKTGEFFMTYNQAEGIGDISLLRLSLYEGKIESSAKINLATENFPYWLNAIADGLKIEKLKNDTPLKDKDISGTVHAEMKLNGFFNDLSKLSGAGKASITSGKLWQLNLFKGIGELLFTKDFADIVFSEGSCEFFVKDKAVFTENLKLQSNLVILAGTIRIGFDSSLDGSINVQMSDEMAPATGTIQDVATALIGQAGRFAVIKLSGSLKEPKHKIQPAVGDVIKGLKDFVIGNVFGK